MQSIPTHESEQLQEAQTTLPAGAYRRREIVFTMCGVLLVMFLAALDQTIVSTAIPHIVADLQGFEQIAWVATIYLLTSTVTIPIYGKLSDLLGRKPIFLFGIVMFLICSALSGAAQSMTQLIMFRGLQGIGAGALLPIASAVVGDLFPPRERGKWQGVTGSTYALAAIIGPLAGGWLTDHLSWRWIFYVNLPIGLVALLVLIFLMPPLRKPTKRVFIDYIGTVLLVLGTLPLLLGFTWAGNQYAWLSPQIIGLFAAAAVLLTLLVLYEVRLERRGKEPIFEPSLFKNSVRIFTVSLLVTLIFSIALVGCAYFIPLFVQGVVGTSATNSGLVLMPLMITAIVGSTLSGLLVSFSGRYKWIAVIGVLISIVGTLLLVGLDVHSSWQDVLIAMLVLGLGMGSGQAVYTIIVQNALPGKIGQATSSLVFFRQLGQSISLAAMGGVVTSSYVPAFHAALSPLLRQALPARIIAIFENPLVLLSPGNVLVQLRADFASRGPQGVAAFNALIDAVKIGLAQSIHNIFVLSVGIMIVALVVVCFLKEIPLRKGQQDEESAMMF
jgi:EmrB/QacA subfamily drug resistance transporter